MTPGRVLPTTVRRGDPWDHVGDRTRFTWSTQVAAVLVVVILLAACSSPLVDGDAGPGPHPDLEAPGSARLEVEGDQAAELQLPVVWNTGPVLGRTAEAAAEEFRDLQLLPVEYQTADQESVVRISEKQLHVRLDRTSFRASLADCTVDTSTGGRQRWGGTIVCTGVDGLTPGSDSRPTVDLRVEFAVTVPVCVVEDVGDEAGIARGNANEALHECYSEAGHDPRIRFRG